jgi:hypothetical protein
MLKAAVREITPPIVYKLAHRMKSVLGPMVLSAKLEPDVSVQAATPEPEWQVVDRWETTSGNWTAYTHTLIDTAQDEIDSKPTSFTALMPQGAP